jgi:hypothetical protein
MTTSRFADRQAKRFRAFSILTVIAALIAYWNAEPDMRAVLGPIIAIVTAVLWYLSVQIAREGHLPIFEAATFFVLATAVYSIVPLLQYMALDMSIGPLGDNRTYQYAPTPQEYGGFAWRHAVLVCTFVAVYLLLRGKRLPPMRRPFTPTTAMIGVILVTMILLTGWFLLLRLYGGPSVSVYEGGTGVSLQVPHVVLQISNVLQAVRLTLKQCLAMILLMRWQRRASRYALMVWVLIEVIMTIGALESRTGTMVLLLTCIVGYHVFVSPLRVARAAFIGGALLLGFLAYGFARDLRYATDLSDRRMMMGTATEFQILYGTAFDLHKKRENRELPRVPPQLYFSDLYRLVPSQLLPFYKWDPSQWYLEVLGIRETGVGLMFGIISQSVIGFGYRELVVRAILLAAFYAVAHRIYRRYSNSFWTTIAYLYILTWAYYAFRSTSFEILYRLFYYFLPTWALVKALTMVVTKVRKPFRRVVVRA